jgi:hypothetical protein
MLLHFPKKKTFISIKLCGFAMVLHGAKGKYLWQTRMMAHTTSFTILIAAQTKVLHRARFVQSSDPKHHTST